MSSQVKISKFNREISSLLSNKMYTWNGWPERSQIDRPTFEEAEEVEVPRTGSSAFTHIAAAAAAVAASAADYECPSRIPWGQACSRTPAANPVWITNLAIQSAEQFKESTIMVHHSRKSYQVTISVAHYWLTLLLLLLLTMFACSEFSPFHFCEVLVNYIVCDIISGTAPRCLIKTE